MIVEILSNVLVRIVRAVCSPRTVHGWNNLRRLCNKINWTTNNLQCKLFLQFCSFVS